MLDAADRRRRARIAALDRTSAPGYDGAAATGPATAGYWAKYEAQVDPQGLLPLLARERKAKKAWLADMERGKLAKRQGKRRARR